MSGKLIQSTSIVGSMTLLSRISGLIRDVIFANVLGDKAAADVFLVAFRIPNFFRRLFGEGAFSAAFIPVFTEYRTRHSENDTNRFLELLIGRVGLFLMVLAFLGIWFSPALVATMATGFLDSPEKFALASEASRITFPYVFFICLVAISAGMLNTCGRFAAPAATPVLLNVCLIGAALVLVPMMRHSAIALSVGVLIAGILQLLFQLPFLAREGLLVRPRLKKQPADEKGYEGVVKVFKLTAPAILGVSVAQINVLVNGILASFLVTGSISWLYYSDRLMEFPVGVFGIALGTTILPFLSRQHASANGDGFSVTLDWALRWVMLICIPCTAGLAMLAQPMVATIYFHGDFTANGVNMTALALIAYSVGLTPIVMVKILAPGFYARQNTRTPVRIAMISLSINIVASLILVSSFKHVGLASATSIAAVFNALLLGVQLHREGILKPAPGWFVFGARVLLATLAMTAFLLWLRQAPGVWINWSIPERVWSLTVLITGGGLIYILTLLGLGLKPRSLVLPQTDSDQ